MDFRYDPSLIIEVRQMLFGDGDNFRTVNLKRCEDLLGGHSSRYVEHKEIQQRLSDIFSDAETRAKVMLSENEKPSVDGVISLATGFASSLWAVHPYSDGNTRLTVSILMLYLKQWGLRPDNWAFRRYPMSFRNVMLAATESEEGARCAEMFVKKALNGEKDFDDLRVKITRLKLQ